MTPLGRLIHSYLNSTFLLVDVSICSCKSLMGTSCKVRPWKRLVIQKVLIRWFPTWQSGFLGKGCTRTFQKCLSRLTHLWRKDSFGSLGCVVRTLNFWEDCRRWTFDLYGKLEGEQDRTERERTSKWNIPQKTKKKKKKCVCHWVLNIAWKQTRLK